MNSQYVNYWAKADDGGMTYHLLPCHLLDVAAWMKELLERVPHAGTRLAEILALDKDGAIARAAFHIRPTENRGTRAVTLRTPRVKKNADRDTINGLLEFLRRREILTESQSINVWAGVFEPPIEHETRISAPDRSVFEHTLLIGQIASSSSVIVQNASAPKRGSF